MGHPSKRRDDDPKGCATRQHSNIYAMGHLLATYDSDGTRFHLEDALGSRRIQARTDGTVGLTCFNYPFGDGLNCTGSDRDATEHHFTGKERDAESGNDYFGARYYTSDLGRFLIPDWSAKAEPVPYAKLDNPQTLNLYSYVRNNPITLVDPDGHAGEEAEMAKVAENNHTMDAAEATYSAGAAKPSPPDSSAQQQNGPGIPMSTSTYKTATGAATAALDNVIGRSQKTGWEYGGRIVKLANGKYGYVLPTTDKSSTSVDVDAGMKEGTRIPAGTTDAGMYHTHPTSCAYCAHDQFSGADNAIAVREQLPSYIESGATRSIYMLPVRPSILDPTPPVVIRYGPPQ